MPELILPMALILLILNYCTLLILDNCPGVQETRKHGEADKKNAC